jgi:hypothetical protein
LAVGEREKARRVLMRARRLREPGGVFEAKVLGSIAEVARLPRATPAKSRK